MRIVHLSDPHLTTGPTSAGPALGLERALRRAAAIDPPPDCIVVTGDLADAGRRGEYADLRRILDDVPLPVHLAIGNHDDRDFVEAFAGSRYLDGGSRCHYAVEYAEATVVVLDSKDDGTAAGHLDPEQLGWLDDQLARRPAVPSVICLHHPPVPVGIPALDAIRLANPEELQEVLGRHRPVTQILAGHVHRVIGARFAGSPVAIAPSTSRQVDLQLRPDRTATYVDEPIHVLLHLLAGDGCVTHLVPVTHTSAVSGTA